MLTDKDRAHLPECATQYCVVTVKRKDLRTLNVIPGPCGRALGRHDFKVSLSGQDPHEFKGGVCNCRVGKLAREVSRLTRELAQVKRELDDERRVPRAATQEERQEFLARRAKSLL